MRTIARARRAEAWRCRSSKIFLHTPSPATCTYGCWAVGARKRAALTRGPRPNRLVGKNADD